MTGSIITTWADYSDKIPGWLLFIIFFATTTIALIFVDFIRFWRNKSKAYNQALETVNKYSRILKKNYTEKNKLFFNKDSAVEHWKEAEKDFQCVLIIPEIENDDKLTELIENTENHIKAMFDMAAIVSLDGDEIEKSKKFGIPDVISREEYIEQTKGKISGFLKAKEHIEKYRKGWKWLKRN